jgi:thiol-disulfide isomerase/thioredoxin
MRLFIAGGCKGSNERLFIPENGVYNYSGLVNRASEGIIFTTTKGKISVDDPTVIHFIVEPGNMTVSFSMENNLPKNIQITGSKSEAEKERWEKKYAPVFTIEKKCRQELGELNRNHRGDTTEMIKKRLEQEYAEFDAIRDIRAALAQDYVDNHPYSYFSAYLLFKYFHIMQPDSAAESFVRFDPAVAQSQLGMAAANKILLNSNNWNFIKKYADSSFVKKWINSKNFYDLSSNDTSGKHIDFSTFKGKYLFIDFWATWCGPCINIGLPMLREAVANTKDLPIEYVSINVNDKSEVNKWKQFVSKLNYPRINVFDGDQFLRSYFKVYLYPTDFIINPEGKIISRNAYNSERPLSELLRDLITKGE